MISCTGAAVAPYLDDLARLRIAVFRDWPYLYEGDPAYERHYLEAYAASTHSVFALALDGDAVVGAASGLPLADDAAAFQQPFRERGIALEQVFYFGESVLLEAYRGQGIGHRFFDEREAHARRSGGFAMTAFCAVERSPDDSRCPAGHRPNDAFWRKRGYQRQDDMFCTLDWTERGAAAPSSHRLRFWLRAAGGFDGMARTLAEWLAYQERVNVRSIELGLERVRSVWQRMGAPAPAQRVITVGGTNGKGSTVALLEAMLLAAGLRVGCIHLAASAGATTSACASMAAMPMTPR